MSKKAQGEAGLLTERLVWVKRTGKEFRGLERSMSRQKEQQLPVEKLAREIKIVGSEIGSVGRGCSPVASYSRVTSLPTN